MKLRIAEKTDHKLWNSLVNHPLQTWEWGEAKGATGKEIARILLIEDNKPVGVVLLTFHALPFGKKVAYCGRSPWLSHDAFVLLKSFCKKCNCIALKLEPDVLIQEAGMYKIPLLHRTWKENGCTFIQSHSTIMAQHTFLMDLALSEEALFDALKSKTRYNIRLSIKKGVSVKDTTNESKGFDDFFSLYQETTSRQQYYGRGKPYLEAVWHEHKGTIARIYTAFYEKKPLASYMVFYWGNRAFYVYGGSSDEHKEVMASNLLMWEVIRDAKRRDAHWFDMWGALSRDYNPHDHWAGFHRFKEGYNPQHATYLPPIDLIIDSSWYYLFDLLWPVRNKLLQLTHVRT